MKISTRPAVFSDLERIVELKSRVMKDDLIRVIGAWNPERSRERVTEHFSPDWTHMVLADEETVGTITLRPADGVVWLEMFYLEPAVQGRGIGTAVLQQVFASLSGTPIRLEVLDGARVRELYERHGFRLISTDGIDDVMERSASTE